MTSISNTQTQRPFFYLFELDELLNSVCHGKFRLIELLQNSPLYIQINPPYQYSRATSENKVEVYDFKYSLLDEELEPSSVAITSSEPNNYNETIYSIQETPRSTDFIPLAVNPEDIYARVVEQEFAEFISDQDAVFFLQLDPNFIENNLHLLGKMEDAYSHYFTKAIKFKDGVVTAFEAETPYVIINTQKFYNVITPINLMIPDSELFRIAKSADEQCFITQEYAEKNKYGQVIGIKSVIEIPYWYSESDTHAKLADALKKYIANYIQSTKAASHAALYTSTSSDFLDCTCDLDIFARVDTEERNTDNRNQKLQANIRFAQDIAFSKWQDPKFAHYRKKEMLLEIADSLKSSRPVEKQEVNTKIDYDPEGTYIRTGREWLNDKNSQFITPKHSRYPGRSAKTKK